MPWEFYNNNDFILEGSNFWTIKTIKKEMS